MNEEEKMRKKVSHKIDEDLSLKRAYTFTHLTPHKLILFFFLFNLSNKKVGRMFEYKTGCLSCLTFMCLYVQRVREQLQ